MMKKFRGDLRITPSKSITADFPGGSRTASAVNAIELMKRGLIIFRVSPGDLPLFQKWIESVSKLPDMMTTDIVAELKIKGKPRSLAQNALYWALINVLAMEVYHEAGWEEVIHEEMLNMYSPKIKSKLHGTEIPKRSKELDTAEFTRLIEGVFYEINENGVDLTEPADLDHYWKEYAKIRFSGGKDNGFRKGESIDDYRRRVNYCEACRKYLRSGSFGYDGNIAHIVSRGSGGADETWNVFHLCSEHHLFVQHQKGWNEFLSRFPHLKQKYEIAIEKHWSENDE